MRRINSDRHKKLLKTLLDLEKIIGDNQESEAALTNKQELENAIDLLISTHRQYEALHQQLSSMTDYYNKIYKELSTQMLAPTLRTLKKEIEDNSPYYFLFREILQSTKGL